MMLVLQNCGEEKQNAFWIEIVLKARLMEWKIHKYEKSSSSHTYTHTGLRKKGRIERNSFNCFSFWLLTQRLDVAWLLSSWILFFLKEATKKKVFILFGVIELWHFESFPLFKNNLFLLFCVCMCVCTDALKCFQ